VTSKQTNTKGIPEGAVVMTLDEVCAKTRLGKAHIYQLIADGKFPKQAKFGWRSLWKIAEVDAWIESKFAER
jgi:excisionase family DNA binding protein